MEIQATWAWIIGIILILVGILGFVNDPILGLFEVNGLHNTVHLLTGLIFVWGAWKGFSKPVNKWAGVIYLLLGIVGFFITLSFLDISSGADPDNFLHLIIGLVSGYIGWIMD